MLCVCVQSCLTLLRPPVDCNPPGCFVLGIFLARTLELVAISSSRVSSWPDQTHLLCLLLLLHWQADSLPLSHRGGSSWLLDFIKCFICICWDNPVVTVHYCSDSEMVYHTDFCVLKQCCFAGGNPWWYLIRFVYH